MRGATLQCFLSQAAFRPQWQNSHSLSTLLPNGPPCKLAALRQLADRPSIASCLYNIFAIPDQHDNFAGMEITLNNEPMTMDGDSITVEKLLDMKRYTFKLRIVKVNGRIIDRDSYGEEMIRDGDTVQVIYLMSGG